MTRRIFIHAGAHRTGSSSFQQSLFVNRHILAKNNFAAAYPGRDGVPEGHLRLQLPRKRHGPHRVGRYAARIERHLAQTWPDQTQDLILSEENIPGLMRNFFDGLFMAGSRNRLASLRQGLGQRPEHVIFVIRPYAPLFLSTYRLTAQFEAVPDFSTLRDVFSNMDRGWSEIVTEFQEVLEPASLTVIDYAARGKSVDLLKTLVPDLAGQDLSEPGTRLNQSATDAALEQLQVEFRAGHALTRADIHDIVMRYAGHDATGRFAAFAPAQSTGLETQYQQDLQRIGEMAGVRLISA